MARSIRRYLVWLVMVMGCSSQPFCDFHDTAPVLALPVPDNVASQAGWGSIMMPISWDEDGIEHDFLAVAGGPRSQTELFQLGEGNDMTIQNSQVLTGICDADETDDEDSTCYERNAGMGIGYRSQWDDGFNCLAVGMAGNVEDGGLAFWCANGTRHRSEANLLTLDWSVMAMASVWDADGDGNPGVERIFLGTDRSLHMLDGDSIAMVRALWEYEGLPRQADPIAALSAIEATDDESDYGYLLAIGFPESPTAPNSVLIVEVVSPAEDEEDAALIPRDCITNTDTSFGSVVKLARLEPGGAPVLFATSRWGTEGRNDVVHIFELEQLANDTPPEEVVCTDEIMLTLACSVPDGAPSMECTDNSGFGASIAIGDIDDTDEYEVLVGCPGCTADGMSRAGAGLIFRPAREDDVPLAVLTDSSEERAEAQLGAGVSIAEVGWRDEPILAGPGEQSLLMFLCTGVGVSSPDWDSPTNETGSLEDGRCRNPAP